MRVCSTLPVSRDWWWPSNQETKIPTTNGKGRDINLAAWTFGAKFKIQLQHSNITSRTAIKLKTDKGCKPATEHGLSIELDFHHNWVIWPRAGDCQGACYQDRFYYDLVQRVEQRCLGHLSSHTEIHAAFSLRLWIWYTHKNLNERERKKCPWIGLCWEKTHFSNLLHLTRTPLELLLTRMSARGSLTQFWRDNTVHRKKVLYSQWRTPSEKTGM